MSDETEEKPAPVPPPTAAPTAPPGALTRPTDHATRPGFRSAPNTKSKAQKAPKDKKRR